MSEKDPLLLKSENKSNNVSSTWTNFHTIWGILIRVLADSLRKNIVVFYNDYRIALGLTMTQFSFIIIVDLIAGVVVMLILPFITNIIPNLRDKITLFGCLSGITSILFIFSIMISSNTYFILIWSCLNRFVFGISFYVYITSIIDLATKTIDTSSGKQGKTISYLNLSWTFASLLYFPVGYTIEYIGWWFMFVVLGILLCVVSIISYFIFARFTQTMSLSINEISETSPASVSSTWLERMRSIFYSKQSMLIFSGSILMGFYSKSLGIIALSVWFEQIYNLNASQFGTVTLVIFAAELCAALSLSRFVDKYGAYICGFLSFTNVLIPSVTIFVLLFVYGTNIGGMVIAIVCIFFLYVGWEGFMINHQLLCIQNAPSTKHTSLMIMINYGMKCIGAILGCYIAPYLWNNGNGFSIIVLLWIICVSLTMIFYVIMYYIKNDTEHEILDADGDSEQHVDV